MMNVRLSDASSSTRFESVVETLRAAVLAGEFQAGERLHG
jgi:GntR family transcriptional regulator of vanillate catabolism